MRRPSRYPNEKYKQLRPPIVRGAGFTENERHLAALADKSFLRLWSYPSPFRKQKTGGSGDGKELCDLLVVCGNHILIFSEKTIGWCDGPIEISWPRWFRKAVREAVKQARGAERWIRDFPELIYLDKECETPFPISFPSEDDRILHRIVVARGAGEACRRHFNGGTGSFAIDPRIKGDAHWDARLGALRPFCIGDIDLDGAFVHVLDDGSLNFVLSELDTISDFTAYLQRKAEFVRSGKLAAAHGEEDLLAYYAVNVDDSGRHEFSPPSGKTWESTNPVAIDGTHYTSLIRNPLYLAKKQADGISYLWDELIDTFLDHMLGGTSVVPEGMTYNLRQSEFAVRLMALVPRVVRRGYGLAIREAVQIGSRQEMFVRAMLPPVEEPDSSTGFFLLIVQFLPWMRKHGYSAYKAHRQHVAAIYAQAFLIRYSYLERIVGIVVQPPSSRTDTSEDIVLVLQQEWTDEQRSNIRDECERLGIMRPDSSEKRYQTHEFPTTATVRIPNLDLEIDPRGMNRKERRRAQALSRKGKR